jgi:glycosyltransferase involved in cell wall biosynthesis
MRIAVLTEIPAPFRIPLFNELARRVELRVLFASDTDPKRPYPVHDDEFAFSWSVLPGWGVIARKRWLMLNRRVVRELWRFRPDVVMIGGWNQPAFWEALCFATARRRTALCWVESTARDERPGSMPRERAKRLFLRACDGFVVPGSASRDYLLGLGVPEERIAIAPNAIDASIFAERVAAERLEREDLRVRLGVNGYCILTIARLDPEKSIDLLIRAIAKLEPDVELVVAGTGSCKEELRLLAADLAPERVRFLGFVSRDELVSWYAAADVFALPSRSDQWGMALSEAAAAGLPLLASEAVGGAWELIEDGVNGLRLPVGDEAALVEALERFRADVDLRATAGARSAQIASSHTPEAWAAAVASLATRLERKQR